MSEHDQQATTVVHSHVFLGASHDRHARRTWAVIALCAVMMIVEIVGGTVFGSLALVADGLHMSTHAGAMLITALAYTYARRHAEDRRFVFGTGKMGDLAGFTSAIVLAMIALVIGYEAITRLMAPVPIHFSEAIPIAIVGLLVNIASASLLGGDDHHGHDHHDRRHDHAHEHRHGETDDHEHKHHVDHRDHNMRAAYVHVLADAAVSLLAIGGLVLAKVFGWLWMDPVAGIVGALVIASWSYGLIRDTGAVLLDVNVDDRLVRKVRETIERQGDRLTDLHVWRLGPGHVGAVASVVTAEPQRGPAFYHAQLRRLEGLSHVTIEVHGPQPLS